jgi:hypothetical protein
MNLCKRGLVLAVSMALSLGVPGAVWADLLTNGDFSSNAGNGQLGYTTSATGWSVPSTNYAFLFGPASGTASGTTADNGGAVGQYGGLQLWGPGTGVANGLTTSPAGGWFVAMDGAFQPGAVSQQVTGLTAGTQYNVGFWWAAGQQYTFGPPGTYDSWQVSLGSQTLSTATVNVPYQGFSGWMYSTLTFTATASSEALSFLAVGGPNAPSLPPFALLDGVTMNAVPEPSSLVVSAIGTVGFLAFALRRRLKSARV